MTVIVRELSQADRPAWEVLWQGYQIFYKVDLLARVTDSTWARFFSDAEPVFCLVAEAGGDLLGFVHYIFHRNTWMVENVCYLHDLFTAPAARGKGVARKLIEAVYAKAEAAGSTRVYWVTHETNTRAMALYDKVAAKSGFLQYRKQV